MKIRKKFSARADFPGRDRAVRTRPSVFLNSVSVREKLKVMGDSDLVIAFLQGEERAFNEIVDRYQKRLLGFIFRAIGDKERTEDLVQEVFIRVYRHLHRFDRSKKFSTWIYTIASNLAKNELRNRSRNPLVLFASMKPWNTEEDQELPMQFEDFRLGPERLFEKRNLHALVDGAIAQLPTAHFREVFILRELEGRSYEEIAEITGVNLGTVKSRLNRARTAFVAIIGPSVVD